MFRPDDVMRAFLRFLYTNPRFRPTVAGFFQDTDATVDGVSVTAEELEPVLTRLCGHGLVAASTTVVDGLPERVGLTGAGLICAGEYDGDLRAWKEQASPHAPVLETASVPRSPEPPVLGPVPPAVLVPARRTESPTAGLARVTRVLLLTLPSVQRDQTQCETLRSVAERLLTTLKTGGPPEELRTLTNRVRTELVNGPVAETLGVVLLDGLDEEIAEWERSFLGRTRSPSPTLPSLTEPIHVPPRVRDAAADLPHDGPRA